MFTTGYGLGGSAILLLDACITKQQEDLSRFVSAIPFNSGFAEGAVGKP